MAPTWEQAWEIIYKPSGWNDQAAARADYNAGGWQNKAGAWQRYLGGVTQDPNQRLDNAISQSEQRLQQGYEEFSRRKGEYKRNNPWSFDDYLTNVAKPQAEEQVGIGTVGTYYQQNLSDYLLGVSRKRDRSASDTRDLIGELQASTQSFGEQTQLRLNEAMNRAREGFADVGLFESGARLRGEGLLETAQGMETDEFTRQQALRQKKYELRQSRGLEDLALESKIQEREFRHGSQTAVESLAAQLTGEKGMARNRELYNLAPPEIQANLGFDIIKQMGINS